MAKASGRYSGIPTARGSSGPGTSSSQASGLSGSMAKASGKSMGAIPRMPHGSPQTKTSPVQRANTAAIRAPAKGMGDGVGPVRTPNLGNLPARRGDQS
jgi:hypothetical protein